MQVVAAGFSAGTIELAPGSSLGFNGSLQFDQGSWLESQPGSTLSLAGNLLGNTRSSSLFSPEGDLVFGGVGTPPAAQTNEVMSQDLGAVPAGFANNFAYGTITLVCNAYVRLVDNSRNSQGTNAEALYVNALSVPLGTTLDLNGLHVYSRISQVGGTVLGGSITPVSTGGTLGLGGSVDGSISMAGQVDDWTFFGRTGQVVAVVLDPGSTDVVPPGIGYAEVRVLDPQANLLVVGTNAIVNQLILITNMNLLANGVYHVQVEAPPGQPASMGNYQLTIWDATPNVMPLSLNEQQNGQIQNPFKIDEWVFSATAGEQINLELLNESLPGLAFDLHGPNGWVGFTNVTDASGLVDLPYSGSYTLIAYG
ncbi:MAG: hypothetical protein ACREIC_22420, partial [Limisphaerales bacterium]